MRPTLFNIDTALLTTRCVIRRFRENDGAAFYELVDGNRDYLADHFPVLLDEIGTTADGAEAFLRERIAYWLLQQDFAFGIWSNETTELIGFVHLFDLNWNVPAAEVSFFLSKAEEEKGIMTEVLARIVRFAFRQLKLEKLYLKTLADNYRSQRVARKVGFSREGELRNEFRRQSGMLVDLVRFGLSRETYGE